MGAKTVRLAGVAFAVVAILIAAFFWYHHATYLRRVLGIDALPSSVYVVHEYSESWTDFYSEWVLSIDPGHIQALLAGHRFTPLPLKSEAVVLQTERGAHSLAYLSGEAARDPATAVFTVGSAYRFLTDQGVSVNVTLSKAGDMALVQVSGD